MTARHIARVHRALATFAAAAFAIGCAPGQVPEAASWVPLQKSGGKARYTVQIGQVEYAVPRQCLCERLAGGAEEGRLNGGGDEGRMTGGDQEGRLNGGGQEGRMTGGGNEGRMTGGDQEGRLTGGGQEGRMTGGDQESRTSGGDASGHACLAGFSCEAVRLQDGQTLSIVTK